jgi:hypothetical protein
MTIDIKPLFTEKTTIKFLDCFHFFALLTSKLRNPHDQREPPCPNKKTDLPYKNILLISEGY